MVKFRNPDRAADRGAEVVLLIDRDGDAGAVVEEVVRVERVVTDEFVSGAMK